MPAWCKAMEAAAGQKRGAGMSVGHRKLLRWIFPSFPVPRGNVETRVWWGNQQLSCFVLVRWVTS